MYSQPVMQVLFSGNLETTCTTTSNQNRILLLIVFVSLNIDKLNIQNQANVAGNKKTKAVDNRAEKVNIYLTFIDLHDF